MSTRVKRGGGLPSVLVIVGPTASGKSSLAIEIAKKYNGEIISADSRAIYKYIDIASAKPSFKEREGVMHWGVDLVGPEDLKEVDDFGAPFTVVDFKNYAEQKIEDILSRGKLPIVVGGSGLYIDALIYDYQFDGASQDGNKDVVDQEKRRQLNEKTVAELQEYCIKNNIKQPSNFNNKRYLVRVIEKHKSGVSVETPNKELNDRYIVVGLTTEKELLDNNIVQRILNMLKQGVADEYKKISKLYHIDSEALKSNAYIAIKRHPKSRQLQQQEMIRLDKKLVKKQLTWFRRNEHIIWMTRKDAPQQIANVLDM